MKITPAVAGSGSLPTDRLWTIVEAACFFQKGPDWVRANVPAVLLPGEGDRRSVRFLPETCKAFARQHQTSNRELGQSAAEHAA